MWDLEENYQNWSNLRVTKRPKVIDELSGGVFGLYLSIYWIPNKLLYLNEYNFLA